MMVTISTGESFPNFNRARKAAKRLGLTEISISYPFYLIDSYTTDQMVQLPNGSVVKTGRKITEYIREKRTFTYSI
jgi:hypothetical protein